MKRSLLLLCMLFSSAAHAAINVPAAQSGTPFEIQIDAYSPDCSLPTNPRLLVAGKTILITFTAGQGCAFEPTPSPWRTSIAIPGLAAGTYHVQVRIAGSTIYVFEERDFTVSGPSPGIEISPSFDANAGNRVIRIRGSFPGAIPTVLFGNKPAEGVERISDTELHALVPFQTNVRVVDVTVRGDNYNYVLPSGFTYVGNDYRPIILPVYTNRAAPGAFGSLWLTEFRFVNLSQLTFIPGIDVLYMDGDFPPGRVRAPKLTTPREDVDNPPIAVAWIRNELAPFVTVELRARDISRSVETWGTEIPVIFGGKYDLNLLDVPVRDGFRSLLRVYSAVYGGCCGVTVNFKNNDGEVLASRTFQMQHPPGSIGGFAPPPYRREGSRELPLQPAYGELDLQSIPELAGHDAIWIQITTSAPSWAFVTATNNATQHVTTITPR